MEIVSNENDDLIFILKYMNKIKKKVFTSVWSFALNPILKK
jgi:hypothetical protein